MFILTSIDDLLKLSDEIDKSGSSLKITLDIPQLFTTLGVSRNKAELMAELFEKVSSIRHNIRGIHLWGEKSNDNGRRVAHVGDLNDYFLGDKEFKSQFLGLMHEAFSDDKERYFVPEVNSGTPDLISIVEDLRRVGFIFL